MEIQYRQSGKTQLLVDLMRSVPLSWKERLQQWWSVRYKRRLRRLEARMWSRDRKERQAIARAFNDRYAIAERYDLSSDKSVPGQWNGTPYAHPQGNRWMCPTCNRLHAPVEFNPFTGLHYPTCCEHQAGPCRAEQLGPACDLKRPLGWHGPNALALKFRQVGLEVHTPHYGDRIALILQSKSKEKKV